MGLIWEYSEKNALEREILFPLESTTVNGAKIFLLIFLTLTLQSMGLALVMEPIIERLTMAILISRLTILIHMAETHLFSYQLAK